MKKASWTGSLLAALCWAGCQEKTLEVNHYQAPCIGVSVQACLVVRDDPAQQWTWDYSGVRGFVPQWGHTYRLRVRVEQVRSPAPDSSSGLQTLLEVQEERVVAPGTPFSLTLYDASFYPAVTDSAGTYRLLGQRELSCEPAVCAALDAALRGSGTIVLDLRHATQLGGPLGLLGVR